MNTRQKEKPPRLLSCISWSSDNKHVGELCFINFSKHTLKQNRKFYSQKWYWEAGLGFHSSGVWCIGVFLFDWLAGLFFCTCLVWFGFDFVFLGCFLIPSLFLKSLCPDIVVLTFSSFLPSQIPNLLPTYVYIIVQFYFFRLHQLNYLNLVTKIILVFDLSIDPFLLFPVWMDICRTTGTKTMHWVILQLLGFTLTAQNISNWLFSFSWHFLQCLYFHKGGKEMI